MTAKTIRVAYKAPQQPAEARDIPNTLSAMQALVEGYVEQVSGFNGNMAVFCNEEGKLKGLKPNIIGPYDILVGPVFVGIVRGESLRSLTEQETSDAIDLLNDAAVPSEGPLCPRCRKYRLPLGHMGALSRADDQTEVCSPCGTDEALRAFRGMPVQKRSEWPVEFTFEEVAVKANPPN